MIKVLEHDVLSGKQIPCSQISWCRKSLRQRLTLLQEQSERRVLIGETTGGIVSGFLCRTRVVPVGGEVMWRCSGDANRTLHCRQSALYRFLLPLLHVVTNPCWDVAVEVSSSAACPIVRVTAVVNRVKSKRKLLLTNSRTDFT